MIEECALGFSLANIWASPAGAALGAYLVGQSPAVIAACTALGAAELLLGVTALIAIGHVLEDCCGDDDSPASDSPKFSQLLCASTLIGMFAGLPQLISGGISQIPWPLTTDTCEALSASAVVLPAVTTLGIGAVGAGLVYGVSKAYTWWKSPGRTAAPAASESAV